MLTVRTKRLMEFWRTTRENKESEGWMTLTEAAEFLHLMQQNEETVQDAKFHCRDGEKID
jgi:hypothetical protein